MRKQPTAAHPKPDPSSDVSESEESSNASDSSDSEDETSVFASDSVDNFSDTNNNRSPRSDGSDNESDDGESSGSDREDESLTVTGGKKPDNGDMDKDMDSDSFYQKFVPETTEAHVQRTHPQLTSISSAEMAAQARVVRDRTGKIVDPAHQTMPFLTKYEMTTVIGTRAEQIEQGATPFIELADSVINATTIAQMEFNAGVLPFIISRPLPDGTMEYWNLSDLEWIY